VSSITGVDIATCHTCTVVYVLSHCL